MSAAGEHARYESLLGALALGEATDAEERRLAQHAAGCASCRRAAQDVRSVAALFERGSGAETWRPSLDNVVLGKIRDARAKRSSLAVGALGWAIALSLVVNVAVASGFAGRLALAAHDRYEPSNEVVGTRMVFEHRPGGVGARPGVRPPLIGGATLLDVAGLGDGARDARLASLERRADCEFERRVLRVDAYACGREPLVRR